MFDNTGIIRRIGDRGTLLTYQLALCSDGKVTPFLRFRRLKNKGMTGSGLGGKSGDSILVLKIRRLMNITLNEIKI
jgi:hypothetical protein